MRAYKSSAAGDQYGMHSFRFCEAAKIDIFRELQFRPAGPGFNQL